MNPPQVSRTTASYTARLDKTLKRLQDRVKEQEDLLAKLQASTASVDPEPSDDPKIHLRQLRALKSAYETVTPKEPYLPPADSLIPALLALRTTGKCITESQACITTTTSDLQKLQKRLETEQANLRDAQLIKNGLESRISTLEQDIETRTQKTPSQIAKEMVKEIKTKTKHYDTEMIRLVRAFNAFIDEHLAGMLAAEELGGPIVGGIIDVDEEMLEAGFSTQGKARKPKANVNQDKRQRRIDEIWGQKADDEEPWNEQEAAGAEMRTLTEELLNSLVEGPGTYVELKRESAAARFLVRAKVAQFHPKDATMLRLIDFGGEIED